MKASSRENPHSSTSSFDASSQADLSASSRSPTDGAVGVERVGGLGDGPATALALDDVDFDDADAADLDTRTGDLAVAHRRVHVADGELTPALEDRQVDRRADAVHVVIHVAAVAVGEERRDVARGR